MGNDKGFYTENDRFVTAFRVFNDYDDAWVRMHEELGDILKKHDVQDSDWRKKFQGEGEEPV